MNRYEGKIANELRIEVLQSRKLAFKFEGKKLRLADLTFYTPDFVVWDLDEVEFFIEVKGPFKREDAMIKLKVAAEQFPYNQFWLADYREGLDGPVSISLLPGYHGKRQTDRP